MNTKREIMLTDVIEKNNRTESQLQPAQNQTTPVQKPFLKRRYITRVIWILSLITSVILFVFIDSFLALLTTCILISISSLVNILAMFISPKKINFSIDAYISIIISYSIVFSKLVIIPLDISSSVSLVEGYSTEVRKSIEIAWAVIYWTSMIINFLFIQFQMAYWQQGHPRFSLRLFYTLKLFLKKIIIFSIIGTIVFFFLFFKYLDVMEIYQMVFSMIQIINLLYCILHIVFFLGYGLVGLPLYYFFYTDTISHLNSALKSIILARNELEKNVNMLIKDSLILKHICQSLITSNCSQETLNFSEKIIQDISEYSKCFEYNDLCKCTKIEGSLANEGKCTDMSKFTIDKLAEMLVLIKEEFYMSEKKEAALLRIYFEIRNNCDNEGQKLLFYSQENSSSMETSKRDCKIKLLLPKIHSPFISILTKSFSVLLFLLSAIIILLQFSLIAFTLLDFDSRDVLSFLTFYGNFYVTFLIILAYFGFLFICCFFALGRFSIFEIYILVKHHTNKFGMACNSKMCDTIILGIFYNSLFFCSISVKDRTESPTELVRQFKSMQNVTFIMNSYVYAFPTLLLVVVICTLLRACKASIMNCIKLDEVISDEKDVEFEIENGQINRMVASSYVQDNQSFQVIEMIEKVYLPTIQYSS